MNEKYESEIELVCKHCGLKSSIMVNYDHDCLDPECRNTVKETEWYCPTCLGVVKEE